MLSRALFALALTGCIQQEAAISRQGLFNGTAKRGGIGLSTLSSAYRETGTSNIAAGVTITILDDINIGLGGRYAHQIDRDGRLRAFTRASFGLGACQVMTCKYDMAPPDRYAFDVHVGLERMIWAPEVARPQDSVSMSAELGLVYTHSSDEVVGKGDFIGIGLGLRLGFNGMADKR